MPTLPPYDVIYGGTISYSGVADVPNTLTASDGTQLHVTQADREIGLLEADTPWQLTTVGGQVVLTGVVIEDVPQWEHSSIFVRLADSSIVVYGTGDSLEWSVHTFESECAYARAGFDRYGVYSDGRAGDQCRRYRSGLAKARRCL